MATTTAQTDIFTGIGYIVENLLDSIQQMSLNDKMQELQLIVSGLITLSIMYKGYMVLAGKSQDPIRELVWDLSRKALLLTFAMGAGMWLQYSIEAIKAIYEWAGGGISFYQQLDELANSVLDYIKFIWDKSSAWDGTIIFATFMIIIIGICFVALCFELFFSIISCSVSNTFLIIALPLALFCFMWNQTKQVFTQWCQLLLSNTFTLLFLFLFMSFCQSAVETIFNIKPLEELDVVNLFQEVLTIVLISFILVQIIKVIKALAQNLAQVSLDSVMSGVGASQMAGLVAGKAARGVTMAAKSNTTVAGASKLANAGLTVAKRGKAILSKMRDSK